MKKICLFIISLLLPLSISAQVVMGDMDNNGKLEIADISQLVNTVLGKTPQQIISIDNPVDNSAIAGMWYKSKTETITFLADGTTNYEGASNFKYIPMLNYLILCDSKGYSKGIVNATLVDAGTLLINNSTRYTKIVPQTHVASITLNANSIQLYVGASVQISANVLPEDADNRSLIWSSSNEEVATVSEGKVVAVAEGSAVISCKAADGSNVSASCNVTVSTDGNPGQQVPGGSGA